MKTNLYDVLGVDAEASPEQIQAAYVHWARQAAPDRDTPVNERLKELQAAYAVLANPQRRRNYDSRAQPRRASNEAEPFRAPSPSETKSQSNREYSLRDSFASAHPSFDELFDRFWGNFSELSRPKAERIESLTLEIPLSPEAACGGGCARILIPARAQCPACGGRGALGVYQCWQCEGHGSITADYPLDLTYPAGITNEHAVRVPLTQYGIDNFFLTVRFRVTVSE